MPTTPVSAPQADAASPLMRRICTLALVLAVLIYALMVLGATVRAMDAGLSCPDWPLCHGQYLPPFEPVLSTAGPVPTPAQMNAEWFHRLVAGLVSVLMLPLAWLVWKTGRRDMRRFTLIAFALLFVQVLMGAATVLLGNIHYSVAIHLALATALLLSISWIARLAAGERGTSVLPGEAMPEPLRKMARVFLGVLGATILLGAIIATTSGADLVCPAFPACGRDDYAGVGGLVALQMTHRFLAIGFLAWVLSVAVAARQISAVRGGAMLLAGLTLLQVTLGIVNVYFLVPIPVSAGHLATAVAMFFTLFHWSARGTHAR